VWNVWADLWRLLNNKINPHDASERNQRTDEVQAFNWQIVSGSRTWCKAVGSIRTSGLYIHIIHEHLADQVWAVLGDLCPYQNQGLEHLHTFRKLIARHLTNRQIVSSKNKRNRVTQSFSVQLAQKQLMRTKATGEDQKDHHRHALSNAK
jgi:hypothetical protein